MSAITWAAIIVVVLIGGGIISLGLQEADQRHALGLRLMFLIFALGAIAGGGFLISVGIDLNGFFGGLVLLGGIFLILVGLWGFIMTFASTESLNKCDD